jgi:2-polyprenyl-3-methyl-5-hydroxy-6-metoxy-1,4-benzoquinol methylase
MDLVKNFEHVRYTGWRNYGNLWREKLGLDSTHEKHVLDFGCGVGIEALQFAKAGNSVSLYDISKSNIELATRILWLHGYSPKTVMTSNMPVPDLSPFGEIDVFYANGVLHHTPAIREILEQAHNVLSKDGEVRLMLYSDVAWKKYGECDQEKFVRMMDQVGHYADWYTSEKLQNTVDGFFSVNSFDYITDDDRYCVAILRPFSVTT